MTNLRPLPLIALLLSLTIPVGVRAQQDAATASQPKDAPPKRITLNYDNADARRVFDDVGRQLGIKVIYQQGLWNDAPPKITIHADKQLVAVVLVDLYRQANVAPMESNRQSTPGVLELGPLGMRQTKNGEQVPDNPYAGPSVVVGPYVLVASNIGINSTVRPEQQERPIRNANIAFRLVVDPSDPLLGVAGQAQLLTAVDENGVSLLRSDAYYDRRVTAGLIPSTITGTVMYPEKVGKRLAELSGKLLVLRAIESESVDIPDVFNAKGIRKKVAGIPFTLVEATRNDNRITVRLMVDIRSFDSQAQNELHNMFYRNAPQVYNAYGQAITTGSAAAQVTDPGEMLVVLDYFISGPRPAISDAPATLRWTVPVLAEQSALPFTFKDLPLP